MRSDADRADEPAPAGLLHQLAGEALDLGVLALGTAGWPACRANGSADHASAEYTTALTR